MTDSSVPPHRRRVRYKGKNPRRFEEKYKELSPEKYPDAVARVLASGKTPAGTHRPIMVGEILEMLNPQPGQIAVDCTLGYGGHSLEMLARLQPGGRLIGLDADPIELPKTEERLRAAGFGEDLFRTHRANFAGLPRVLQMEGLSGVDCILADLGVSSMQLDMPGRGFSVKAPGPLDMRMNPNKGRSAAALLAEITAPELVELLKENADEPRADVLAWRLAGVRFATTTALAEAINSLLRDRPEDERKKAVRRVFQALRVAVNEEFSALDSLLRHLPQCLNPGGCVAILTFHSGEDRRVKKAFQQGLREGLYFEISPEALRPTAEECRANTRATPAKLRWARKGWDASASASESFRAGYPA
ncbi:16S rRNA (cytosine(1402)-N(4))-methyltransferase RsmH [soil metagenome]